MAAECARSTLLFSGRGFLRSAAKASLDKEVRFLEGQLTLPILLPEKLRSFPYGLLSIDFTAEISCDDKSVVTAHLALDGEQISLPSIVADGDQRAAREEVGRSCRPRKHNLAGIKKN